MFRFTSEFDADRASFTVLCERSKVGESREIVATSYPSKA